MATQARTEGDDEGSILYVASVALIVLGLLFGFAGLPRLFQGAHAERIGKAAPDFSLPVLANAPDLKAPGPSRGSLSLSELKGQAILLDYWATWCGPCQAEAPVVDRIFRRYKEQGLVVLGISIDKPDDAAGIVPWVQRRGLSFTILHDIDDKGARAFDVQNIPTLVLISREGKVLAIRSGVTSDDDLDRLVKQAL